MFSADVVDFHRPWYVGTMTPKDGKDVVIAVDISNRMGSSSVLQEQMKIVVETLLKTVDVKDRVSYFLTCIRYLTYRKYATALQSGKHQLKHVQQSFAKRMKHFEQMLFSF